MVSPSGVWGRVSEADRGADRQTSMPAEFLYNLTKNLTAHLQYNLCAVLPLFCTENTVTCVTDTRNDVLVLVQSLVHYACIDVNVGMSGLDSLNALG